MGSKLPELDMLLVSKSSQVHRKSMLNFAPRIGLTMVDYGKIDAIDNFYTECQNFRDYYRDPYNKLRRPEPFKLHYGECGCQFIDNTSNHLSLPTSWVRGKQPVLYPLNYERDMGLYEGIRLRGYYDSASCIKYKR